MPPKALAGSTTHFLLVVVSAACIVVLDFTADDVLATTIYKVKKHCPMCIGCTCDCMPFPGTCLVCLKGVLVHYSNVLPSTLALFYMHATKLLPQSQCGPWIAVSSCASGP